MSQFAKTANVDAKDDLSIGAEWTVDNPVNLSDSLTPSAHSIKRSDHQGDSYDSSSTVLSTAADIEPTPRKVVALRYKQETTDVSQGHIAHHGSINRSSDTLSENQLDQDYSHCRPCSSQGSPDLQLNEFLNYQTHDISASSMSLASSESYVPMKARPLLSYAEHQKAIYSRPYPTNFNMGEKPGSDVSQEDDIKWLSGDYVNAEWLYDMSLKALLEDLSS